MAPKKKSSKKPVTKLSDSSQGSVKQLWIPVAGVIGAVILINQLVEIWNGNPTRTNYIIASVLLGIWIIALTTWTFGTTIREQKGFFGNRTRLRNKNVPTYKLISGTILLISIVGIIGGAVIFTTQKNDFAKRQDKKTIVLIANFDDGNNGRDLLDIRNSIVDQLKTNLANYEDTEIIALDEIVSTTQGSSYARDVLGDKYYADIVIWGRYRVDVEDSITINIEYLSPTSYIALRESQKYKPRAAIEDLRTAQLRQRIGASTSTLIAFLTGLAQYEAGEYEHAVLYFEDAANQLNDADEIISKSQMVLFLGMTYARLNYNDQALQTLDLAIELNPKLIAAYNARGFVYFNLQEYDEAISDLNKSIELDPLFEFAYYNRGVAYSWKGEYDKAIIDYTQTIRLNPEFSLAYNDRGTAYIEIKQYDKALIDFYDALEIDPYLADAYSGLGIVYRNLKQYDKAIDNHTIAIQLDPDSANNYYNIALVYKDLQQYDKAIEYYTKAIQLNPQYQFAYSNRGNIYRYLTQYENAMADYNRAIQLDPNDAITYDNRGLVYYELHQYDEALSDFNVAIQLDPQLEGPYLHRGNVYQILGRQAEAEADLAKFNELIQNP